MKDFNYASAIYNVEFTGSNVDNAQYSQVMTKFQNSLSALDTVLAERDLVFTLAAWLAVRLHDKDSAITFQTTAEFQNIFKKFDMYGQVYNGTGATCTTKCIVGG